MGGSLSLFNDMFGSYNLGLLRHTALCGQEASLRGTGGKPEGPISTHLDFKKYSPLDQSRTHDPTDHQYFRYKPVKNKQIQTKHTVESYTKLVPTM